VHLRLEDGARLHERRVCRVCRVELEHVGEALGRRPEWRACGVGWGGVGWGGVGWGGPEPAGSAPAAAPGRPADPSPLKHTTTPPRRHHVTPPRAPVLVAASSGNVYTSCAMRSWKKSWNLVRAQAMHSSKVVQRSLASTSTTLASCSRAAASALPRTCPGCGGLEGGQGGGGRCGPARPCLYGLWARARCTRCFCSYLGGVLGGVCEVHVGLAGPLLQHALELGPAVARPSGAGVGWAPAAAARGC
jgi:hypothetical protein